MGDFLGYFSGSPGELDCLETKNRPGGGSALRSPGNIPGMRKSSFQDFDISKAIERANKVRDITLCYTDSVDTKKGPFLNIGILSAVEQLGL